MINILNVNWDYFFPNFSDFNWLEEITEPFFIYDMIWVIRYSSKAKQRNVLARDYYNPVWMYKCFWEYTLIDPCLKTIVICDEQTKISRILNLIKEDIVVYSFSRNEGFEETKSGVNEKNWLYYYQDKISDYHWFKPNWNSIDFQVKGKLLGEFKYNYPKFDIVFVCRSPSKTSSWNDKKFNCFITKLKEKANNCIVYEERLVKKPRKFDKKFALLWLSDIQGYQERLRIRKMNGYPDNLTRRKRELLT